MTCTSISWRDSLFLISQIMHSLCNPAYPSIPRIPSSPLSAHPKPNPPRPASPWLSFQSPKANPPCPPITATKAPEFLPILANFQIPWPIFISGPIVFQSPFINSRGRHCLALKVRLFELAGRNRRLSGVRIGGA
jgi:hypothetical protein